MLLLILQSIVLFFGLFAGLHKHWRNFTLAVSLMSRKLKDTSSSLPIFLQSVLSSATKPISVVAAVVSLVSYFRNLVRILSMLELKTFFILLHYPVMPAFFIAVFATKELMDVQPGNAGDGKLPAIEVSSGPVESKSSSLVDAVLCYVVNSDSDINKNILC
ncbi:uncharacterized protein LOC133785521 [Humulus lupulus]|uniref:uncharacterized protein LOC133785521 n=1 Tax=Humulus lupulus TaxID=3486 RepID=UPI002B41380F|nr:uncharacterized protein LOC133785521 [Humulus lupulus]